MNTDVKNAFLHSKSDVEIYVTQPEGFFDINSSDKALHLIKSLYRLKQAPHIWYLFLCGVIIGLRFVALEIDSCIYRRGDIIAVVYMDDIMLVGATMEQCKAVYVELTQHVATELKGSIKSFLGIDVIHNWSQHLIAQSRGIYRLSHR